MDKMDKKELLVSKLVAWANSKGISQNAVVEEIIDMVIVEMENHGDWYNKERHEEIELRKE